MLFRETRKIEKTTANQVADAGLPTSDPPTESVVSNPCGLGHQRAENCPSLQSMVNPVPGIVERQRGNIESRSAKSARRPKHVVIAGNQYLLPRIVPQELRGEKC